MRITKALTDLLHKLEGWGHSLLLLLPNIVLAVAVLVISWMLAKVVDRALRRVLRQFSVGDEIIDLTAIAVFMVIIIAGVFIGLDVIGLNKTVTSLLAGVGILGLALGLAFQSTGENYVAGIYLSIRRPFQVGHVIGSGEHFGVVEKIALRSTWLRVLDGPLVYLPNKKIFENPIVNYSDNGLRRIDLKVGVTYGADLEQVQRVAVDAVSAVSTRETSRPIEFYFEGFGESSINFHVYFWIPFYRQPDFLAARSEAIMRVKQAFAENGITIPFPIRTLDFARVGGVTLEEQIRAAGLGAVAADGDGDGAPRRPAV